MRKWETKWKLGTAQQFRAKSRKKSALGVTTTLDEHAINNDIHLAPIGQDAGPCSFDKGSSRVSLSSPTHGIHHGACYQSIDELFVSFNFNFIIFNNLSQPHGSDLHHQTPREKSKKTTTTTTTVRMTTMTVITIAAAAAAAAAATYRARARGKNGG